MKLHFLGTRGNIRIRSSRHMLHASLLITHNKKHIMIDCGSDYLGKINQINPDALFITHAHPDHVGGLKKGINCPVYATLETWQVIKNYPIADRRIIVPGFPLIVEGLEVSAYAVAHATNAPAVGYRISDGNNAFFYASDLVKIHKQKEALGNVALYIGDGAIIQRTLLVKKRGKTLIGHSPIITQIKWCKKERVPTMIITHCGTEIVSRDKKDAAILAQLQELGEASGVAVILAHDGMELKL